MSYVTWDMTCQPENRNTKTMTPIEDVPHEEEEIESCYRESRPAIVYDFRDYVRGSKQARKTTLSLNSAGLCRS